jgi:hypothetical protein
VKRSNKSLDPLPETYRDAIGVTAHRSKVIQW